MDNAASNKGIPIINCFSARIRIQKRFNAISCALLEEAGDKVLIKGLTKELA